MDDVERSIVVADRGRRKAGGGADAVEVELRGVGEHVADRAPVNPIAAVVDRQAGEELERRVDQVKIVTDAADGRVGVEPGQDGIAEGSGYGPMLLVEGMDAVMRL
jgi:hypothetical protein